MRGKLTGDFYFTPVTQYDIDKGKLMNIDEVDTIKFEKDEEVEIIKEITTSEFLSKTAYVVYSPETHESMTIDSMLIDLIND